MDKPSSPRFLDPGGPLCPNCTQTASRKIQMKGPVPDPSGKSDDLFFVCGRCKWKMRDRRGKGREKTGHK